MRNQINSNKIDLQWVREYTAMQKSKAWREEELKEYKKNINRQRIFYSSDRTSSQYNTSCSQRSLNLRQFRRSKFTST